MKSFTIFLLLFTGLFQVNINAQTKVILSGTVKEKDGSPLPQTTIAVENTTLGTYSKDNGQYSLSLNPGKYTIVVSSVGYETIRIGIELRNNKRQDFILEESAINLNSVEVYGKTKTQKIREGAFTVNALDIKPLINSLNNLNTCLLYTSPSPRD